MLLRVVLLQDQPRSSEVLDLYKKWIRWYGRASSHRLCWYGPAEKEADIFDLEVDLLQDGGSLKDVLFTRCFAENT